MSASETSVVFTNLNDAVHVQPGLQRLLHSANVISEDLPGGVGFGVLTEQLAADGFCKQCHIFPVRFENLVGTGLALLL